MDFTYQLSKNWNRNALETWSYIQFHGVLFMTIIVFSLFDAIQMSARTKSIVGIAVCLIMTYNAWWITTVSWNNDVVSIGGLTTIDLSDYMSSYLITLTIFVYQQTYYTLKEKGYKCLTIKHRPWVNWFEGNNLKSIGKQKNGDNDGDTSKTKDDGNNTETNGQHTSDDEHEDGLKHIRTMSHKK